MGLAKCVASFLVSVFNFNRTMEEGQMKLVEAVVLISAATLWVFLIGGWNSVYIQRLLGGWLMARADALEKQRSYMEERLKYWKVGQ